MRLSTARLVRSLTLAVFASSAAAHDIPASVTVHAIVKPEGDRLRMLVRVPLRVVRDIEFPQRDRGYLDMDRLAPLLPDAAQIWIANFADIREDGVRLPKPRVAATRISIESDRSFESYSAAIAHVTGPQPPDSANLVWNQVLLDVLLDFPIRSDRSRFSIRPGFAHFAARVTTVLRFVPAEGGERIYEFTGDPGLVPLHPGWWDAALRFTAMGFDHILDGVDHLLFLICLVMPSRRIRDLVWLVTAFTAAHSVTLIASAFGYAPDALWFPPLVETLIAASIVWMALSNIIGVGTGKRRWMAAFGFGLVHGFGFSFALRETLQFAGNHLITALLAFNLGVELGQLAVIAVLVPALGLLFRYVVPERTGAILLSALVAHSGLHWLADRFDTLHQFPLEAPDLSSAAIASALRAAMWIAAAAAAVWAVKVWRTRRGPQ